MKQLKPFFVLLVFLFLTAGAHAEALVSLKPVAEVKKAAIRLSDVFEGIPSDLDQDIAFSPEPGKSVTYNVQVVAKLAQQFGLIWKAQSVADQCVLTRASTYISPEMIRARVEEKIRQIESSEISSLEINFDNRTVGIYLLPEKEAQFDLDGFEYNQQAKRFQVDVVVSSGDAPIRQHLMGRVMMSREVPVLSSRLEGGTVIGVRDITYAIVPDERLSKEIITTPDQIIGMELRSSIAAGEMVRTRDLLPPRLVTRGSVVLVKVETPLMQVTVRGKALQDGALGDIVRVSNTQSKRVLEGVVEANGIIRVETSRQIAQVTDKQDRVKAAF